MTYKVKAEDYHEYNEYDIVPNTWYPITKNLYPHREKDYLFCTKSGRQFVGYMSCDKPSWADAECYISFRIYHAHGTSKEMAEKVIAFMLLPALPNF